MVRFERGKIIVEMAVGDVYSEYLQILHALAVLGWFAAEHDDDETVRKAFGILSFYIGQGLTQMSEEDKLLLDRLVSR